MIQCLSQHAVLRKLYKTKINQRQTIVWPSAQKELFPPVFVSCRKTSTHVTFHHKPSLFVSGHGEPTVRNPTPKNV